MTETQELAQAFLVGGCVRDWVMGKPCRDIDVEVFGQSYESLAAALSRWGRTDLVGRSFGTIKLQLKDGQSYDFSIPRRDSKVAPGHKGFTVEFDETLTPAEAAARRDFTINALMYDPRKGEVLDFFNGREDLEKRVLRHTTGAFTEDALRVLRGMQFASRFNLTAAPETVALCQQIQRSYQELAKERVREEWFKWAKSGGKPSKGLQFLADTGWIAHFPEVRDLMGVPQDPEWHPEGDVFVHTCHCCDALVSMPEWQEADETTRIVLSLAVLTHDFGKAVTTTTSERRGEVRVVSPGHDEAGEGLARQFLERINAPLEIVDRVPPLVANHMAHVVTISDRVVRRLAKRLAPETIRNLGIVMKADASGRPPLPPGMPASVEAILRRSAEMELEKKPPAPLLMGRHLRDLGLEPGPFYKRLLEGAFEAQLDGEFHDFKGALSWLHRTQRSQLPETAVRTLEYQMAAG